jgi:AhpD family alkylhydroperoxidase
MQLEQRDKELTAIGASIGCNCRPRVDHHIPAGRDAGLSEVDIADAVATRRGRDHMTPPKCGDDTANHLSPNA